MEVRNRKYLMFAYDAFHFLWRAFNVTPDLGSREDMYPPDQNEESEFNEVIGFTLAGMQLCFRSNLQLAFGYLPHIDMDDPEFCEKLFKYTCAILVGDTFVRTLGSVVVYAEFAMYRCYHKGEDYCLEDAPECWFKYFCLKLRPAFDACGSWRRLLHEARVLEISHWGVRAFLSQLRNPCDTVSAIELSKFVSYGTDKGDMYFFRL